MPPLAAGALALLLSPAPAAPEAHPPATAPAEAVRAFVRGFPGQVSLFAKNLDTGAEGIERSMAVAPAARAHFARFEMIGGAP